MMENFAFWIAIAIAAFVLHRVLSRRFVGPQATVRGLLRRYHVFEKSGLPEVECLFRLLSTRRGWKRMPERFLMELVARLDSKENVMRFISLAEGYGFDRRNLPEIARKEDMEAAMGETASVLGKLGYQLQNESRFKEAEFVQKLALRLQPNQYFTTLPLAVTYYRTRRYSEAAPLFKRGLAHFEKREQAASPAEPSFPVPDWLAGESKMKALRASCQKMYEACLKKRKKG